MPYNKICFYKMLGYCNSCRCGNQWVWMCRVGSGIEKFEMKGNLRKLPVLHVACFIQCNDRCDESYEGVDIHVDFIHGFWLYTRRLNFWGMFRLIPSFWTALQYVNLFQICWLDHLSIYVILMLKRVDFLKPCWQFENKLTFCYHVWLSLVHRCIEFDGSRLILGELHDLQPLCIASKYGNSHQVVGRGQDFGPHFAQVWAWRGTISLIGWLVCWLVEFEWLQCCGRILV